MNLRRGLRSVTLAIRKGLELKLNLDRVIIAILTLALIFSAGVRIGEARSAGATTAVRPAAPAAPFADSIPIQGRLTNSSGVPLNGSFPMTFNIYNEPSGGTSFCNSANPAVPVANGLWNATIDGCGAGGGLFSGGDQQLYVGIQVGSDPEMTPRQPLFGVPYAQGLMTPLEVSGTNSNPILTVANAGSGDAARFGGNVSQQRTNSGLVKAGALVLCASASSAEASVYRSFNDVNGSAVTIAGGGSAGQCTVDFGFQISGSTGRYYVASPRSNLAQAVACNEDVTNTKLDCFYYNTTTGGGVNGDIEILVY